MGVGNEQEVLVYGTLGAATNVESQFESWEHDASLLTSNWNSFYGEAIHLQRPCFGPAQLCLAKSIARLLLMIHICTSHIYTMIPDSMGALICHKPWSISSPAIPKKKKKKLPSHKKCSEPKRDDGLTSMISSQFFLSFESRSWPFEKLPSCTHNSSSIVAVVVHVSSVTLSLQPLDTFGEIAMRRLSREGLSWRWHLSYDHNMSWTGTHDHSQKRILKLHKDPLSI